MYLAVDFVVQGKECWELILCLHWCKRYQCDVISHRFGELHCMWHLPVLMLERLYSVDVLEG